MDVIMERDDTDNMMLLNNISSLHSKPLAHLALMYNAEKCLQKIIEIDHPSLRETDNEGRTIHLAAASSSLSLLKLVMDVHVESFEAVTDANKTCLHLCTSFSSYRGVHDRLHFIPEDVAEKIKLLLNAGAKANVCDREGQFPIDLLLEQPRQQVQTRTDIPPAYSLQQHSRVVSESCKLLLQAMAEEHGGGGAGFVVPHRTFHILQCHLQGVLNLSTRSVNAESYRSCLELFNTIFNMFLRFGVDLNPSAPFLMLDACFEQCVMYSVMNIAGELEASAFLHNYILKLLAHGATMSDKSFEGLARILKVQPKGMGNTVDVCVSMMFHTVYDAYRRYSDEHHLYTDTLGTADTQYNRQEEQDNNATQDDRSQEKLRTTDTQENQSNPLPSCRDLKELCRLRLYDLMPRRNMVSHVKDMPLPSAIRAYLALDQNT